MDFLDLFKYFWFFLKMSSFFAIHSSRLAQKFSASCPYVGLSKCNIWTCPYHYKDGKYTQSCNRKV